MQIWQLDRDLYRAIHVSGHRDWLDLPMIAVTSTGLGWVQLILLLFILLRAEWRRSSLLMFGSGAFCGLLRLVVMTFADRQRPSNYEFAKPLEQIYGYNSFPSGHTACSFAIAVMLFLLVQKSEAEWLGKIALVWATLVGLSRIYLGVHYPLDVIGGALFGTMTAAIFYLFAERRGWVQTRSQTGSTIPNLPS